MPEHGRLKVTAAQYPLDRPRSMREWRNKATRWVADGAESGAEILFSQKLIWRPYGGCALKERRAVTSTGRLSRAPRRWPDGSS
jgi:hypothetical protein